MENRQDSVNLDKVKISELQGRLADLGKALAVEKLAGEILDIRREMDNPDFWADQAIAAKAGQRLKAAESVRQQWDSLEAEMDRIREMDELAAADESWQLELEREIPLFLKRLEELETKTFLSEEYDANNCLVTISAGTGGVDAQDFAQMLERMVLRYSERAGFKAQIVDRIVAQEAGIKSVTIKLDGPYAYGYLKGENGVHRLERHSPFNAQGKEQTSFVSIEVVPEIEAGEVEIKDEDVRLDVFRSSGPGGQSVNTTDSAVRLVHLPTGITVSCQTERSQHQNKENAYALLRAKLAQRELEKRQVERFQLKGGVNRAEWASHIRSYSLSKLKKVKDRRTGYESNDPQAVLDGELDGFIQAYLRFNAGA